jgi:hypothetical protein
MPHVLQLMAAPAPPPDEIVGPGVGGFLVIFALALATVLLIRSMVGHLRKVRYGPGPPDAGEPETSDGGQTSDETSDGADGAGRTGEHREGV